MKRSLLILLLVAVLAGWLGTLIARDPGYVLISYQDYSMQTSLWVMLALLFGFSCISYIGLRLFGLVRKSPMVFRGWQDDKKSSQANNLTVKGLTLLLEGEFERARRFLDSGAKNNAARGINYLAAARAADDLGDAEARETYLRLSEEADSSLRMARGVTTAELALRRGDYDGCLDAVAGLKANKHVVELKRRALARKGDWRGMLGLLPELRKLDKAVAVQYEREAALIGLNGEERGDEQAQLIFKSLSQDVKQDPQTVVAYIKALSSKVGVETMLRQIIKKSWDPALVELYGELDDDRLKARLKNAEGWLKTRQDDPSLHYCLGCLYDDNGEKTLARQAYTRSVELGGPKAANEKLADLLELEGDLARSNEHLRLALRNGSGQGTSD